MFEAIFIPAVLVAGFGLLAGVGLSIATIVFATPVNEKEEQLREALPGINCGACGFSGCDGYAKALATGSALPNLCAPGGQNVREALAAQLGVESEELHPTAAFVRCQGSCQVTQKKMHYQGVATCVAANQTFGGPQSCQQGCLGFGDCAAACDYGAITVEDGIARVDPTKCVGCEACLAACPKALIAMKPIFDSPVVACQNTDRGGSVRKLCEVGCITCKRCVKACPTDAISIENQVAVIDFDKCTNCGACLEACPQDCIVPVLQAAKLSESA